MDEPRVIRMRTFSKAYGMAGARVGYALGEAGLIAAFDRVRNHFGVNRIAQAGALAALGDRDWLASVLAEVAAAKARIGAIAAGRGLRPLPSATNFVTIDCGRDGAFARGVRARADRAGGLRAHAVRGAAGPLHPGDGGAGGGPRRLRRGAAGGAGRGGRGLTAHACGSCYLSE